MIAVLIQAIVCLENDIPLQHYMHVYQNVYKEDHN